MRSNCLLALSALALLRFAMAEEPAPDPKVLGTTEAILAYCAKVDPSGASKYQARVQLVTQGASDETLARVRQAGEYQQARDSVDEFVAKIDEHNAMKVCSESLVARK